MSLMYGDDGSGGEPPVYHEYEGFYPGSPCAEIRGRDPEGWEHEPTQAEYAAHREWAIRTFGLETWRSYSGEDRELQDREPGQ
jgi:hypothetical protein